MVSVRQDVWAQQGLPTTGLHFPVSSLSSTQQITLCACAARAGLHSHALPAGMTWQRPRAAFTTLEQAWTELLALLSCSMSTLDDG